jgi:hypothetical protein
VCLGFTISPTAGAPPQLLQAEYSIKEANLLGTTYQYAIFEAQYDQELFYLTDSPCPCVDATHQCPLSLSNVAQPVNETQLKPTVLHEGIWYYGSSSGDSVYYKFEIPVDPEVSCPVVKLEVETEVGTASAFISAGSVPTVNSHTWAFPFNSKDHMVLCPYSPLVSYGTYYLAMIDQFDSAINSWGIRVTIDSSRSCPADHPTPPTEDATWVHSGEAVILSIPPLAVQYRKLWFELADNSTSRCVQFSASVSGRVPGTNADIYVSTENPTPDSTSSVDWFAATSNDDTLSALYCFPEGENTVTFYMGIYNRATSPFSYLFTAWVSFDVQKQPLLQLLYSQAAHSLNFGAAPKLICDTQVFTCRTPADPLCENEGADCCYLFRSVPPTNNPNPLMPWNSHDTSLPQVNQIPWNEAEPLKEGKLAWALYIARTDPTTGTWFTYANPATCRVELGDIIVNAQSEPVSGSISFSPKARTCDATAFTAGVATIRFLVDQMATINDYNLLALQQLRLNIMSMSEDLLGCEDLLAQLTTQGQESREFVSNAACFSAFGTPEWGSDPCCNRTLALSSCCASRMLMVTSQFPLDASKSSVETSCSNPDCATRAVNTYVSSETSIRSRVSGCASQFQASASLSYKASLEAPVLDCRNMLLSDDLRGIACVNDTDCLESASCDPETKRCTHGLDMVTACVAERIDPTVARAMYNLHGFPHLELNISNTIELIKAVNYEEQCVGDRALQYRTAFHYQKLEANCDDLCDRDPVCVTVTCEVPAECNSTRSVGACERYWVLYEANNNGCLADASCNWYDCPSGWTAQQCSDHCLNPMLPTETCVDCSGSACEELAGWNQTACAVGRCTLGSASNEEDCAALGGCSASCPECDTEAGCVQHGICSDDSHLSPYIQMLGGDGVCITPFTYNIDGAFCQDNTTYFVPSGCVDLRFTNETECLGNGTDYIWDRLATTESECLAKGSGCVTELGITLPLSPEECALCLSTVDQPYYTWETGVWQRGIFVRTKWVTRAMENTLMINDSLSIVRLKRSLSEAAADVLTYPFITEALCRYTTSYTVAGSLICDCSPNSAGNCFSSISNQRVGANRACPGISSTVNTRVAQLVVYPDSYPQDAACELAELYSTTAPEFELDESHSLSSAIFQSSPTNSFWVVRRQGLDVAVGQIVSGAVHVSLGNVALANPVQLCIVVETDIEQAPIAKVWSLAVLKEDGTIEAFPPTTTMNYTGSAVCDLVSGSGAYFATKLVKDYQTEEFDSKSNRRQARAGAVLYFCTVAFAILQAVVLILNWSREKIVRLKLVFVALVALNSLVRGVYMLIPSANFVGNESIQFIIFELPSFLFFSVYLAIIYLWVNVTLRASQFRKRKGFMGDAEAISRDVFVAANIFLYAIFIVFMFLISILPTIEKPSVCFLGSQNNSLRNSSFYRTKLAYWSIVAGLCVLVSLGFIIGASMLLRLVLSVERTGVNRHAQGSHRSKRMNKLILISVVAAVCTIFLLIRSALFLYASITSKSINIIVFVLLEVIPSCGLLYYLRPYFLSGRFKSSRTSSRSSDRSTNSATSPRSGSVPSSKYESR